MENMNMNMTTEAAESLYADSDYSAQLYSNLCTTKRAMDSVEGAPLAKDMRATDIKNNAKELVRTALESSLNLLGATILGNTAYVPVRMAQDLTVYVRINFTTCQWTDTKVAEAFDLEQTKADYEFDRAQREKKAQEKQQEKARKEVERAAARREKEKEKIPEFPVAKENKA